MCVSGRVLKSTKRRSAPPKMSLKLGLVEQEESEENGWIADTANNKHQQTANNIGDEGAGALSEALKTNTTLQSLELGGEQEGCDDQTIVDVANNQHHQAGNIIGDDGTRALCEALKTNTTLQSLDLGCVQECEKDGWSGEIDNSKPTSRQQD